MSRRLRVAEDSATTTAYDWAGDVLRPLLTRVTLQPSSMHLDVLDRRVLQELADAATTALSELSDPEAIYRDVGAFVDYALNNYATTSTPIAEENAMENTTPVDLPGGGTAWLRDPADMRERHKRLVRNTMLPLAEVFAAVPAELANQARGTGPEAEAAAVEAQRIVMRGVKTRQQAAAMNEVDDAVIVASLSRWTLPDELPTMDTIQDLEPEVYAALQKAVGGQYAAVVEASLPIDFSAKPKKDVDRRRRREHVS